MSLDGDDTTETVDVVSVVQAASRAEALQPATRIDRFVILEKIGEGGMGAVYAAYDTVLDRKVAMKVVRPDPAGHVVGLGPRERLLREAQAMARLQHPNVVSVLDVGELGENVYLTLELVDGQTLKAWLRETGRRWREIIAAFVDAGRGLAAAHAVGLVHRDVKPDNILVGKDGRIRITDFGVASMHHSRSDNGESDPPEGVDDTLDGLRVGTPAYMAPEQFAGDVIDPRADQFSFCVALWEALFHERPFAPVIRGESFARRPLREVPRDADVPGWLVTAVRRGLSSDPSARWPSMSALLDELTRDRALRRRILRGTGIGAVLALSGTLAVLGWTRDHGPAPCSNEARHLEGLLDDDAFVSNPGTAAAHRVRDHLDRWARGWVEQRTTVCAATRIYGDQSEATLDARMRCLDRRLARVRELVRELGTLDKANANRALEIVSDLPDLQACVGGEVTTAQPPTDPVVRSRVAAIESELARVAAVERTGRYAAALQLALPLLERAAATRHGPLHAEALAVIGRLRVQNGEHAAGIAALREAVEIAVASNAEDIAASTLVELVWATSETGRSTEALAVAAAVGPTIVRVHDRLLEAGLAAEVGDARLEIGDFEGATKELSRALALTEEVVGRNHVRVAQVLNRLGNVENHQNHHEQARAYYTRALSIVEAELGAEHPSAAITRANLCYLDSQAGRGRDAATCYSRVVAALEAALGPDHPQVAWALNDRGLVLKAVGQRDRARADFERSRAIYERQADTRHPDIAWPLINLGQLSLDDGDLVAAEQSCRNALRVLESSSDPGNTFQPLVCVGLSLADRRPVEATTILEKAVRMESARLDSEALGSAQFALAKLALARADRGGAETRAREALAAFDDAGSGADASRASVVTWLNAHHLVAGR